MLLNAGALGDRYGAKRVFTSGLFLFCVASAACGLAPSLASLQIARAVQGVGAALLLPNSLAALNHTVKDPDRRKTAVAAWSVMAGALGVALGPLVGGILVQYLDWRSIFLVNVPVGLVALWLARRHVASGSRQADREFDLSGQGLAIATLAVLTYWMISVGRSHEFSFVTIGLGGLVLVLGGAFLRMKRSRSTRWCHSISYSGHLSGMSRSLASCTMLEFYGLIFVLSLAFQELRG